MDLKDATIFFQKEKVDPYHIDHVAASLVLIFCPETDRQPNRPAHLHDILVKRSFS